MTRISPRDHGASRRGGRERRRLRVRDYRGVYTIDNGEPAIRGVHVGHRSTDYET
ncbi:type II toxin-antitoxin system RelE/ParE family toxin [Streptomyces sp. NPDC002039]|uniref:type II toxin-antitoxin system RelE/ParE family toxin n=1 Tax=Streptomyces sp. NPDC002039 TaxID=3154660 RepID=UPI00332D8ED8